MQIRLILILKSVKLVHLPFKIFYFNLRIAVIISLLAILVYNSVGFVVSFHILRREWRKEVRVYLAQNEGSDEVAVFRFHKNSPNAFKHEFQIEGQFYDVFKREIQGDSVQVECFSDKKETELVTAFHDDIQKNISQKTNFPHKSKHFFSFLIKDFIFEKYLKLSYSPSVSSTFLSEIRYKTPVIICPFLGIESPPPQV